jgi:uncharacterized protein (UPF0261 family)
VKPATTVLLVGTLDTKGEEYAFLRDRLAEAGCGIVVMNAGPMGDPVYPVDYDRRAVAEAAGADLDSLVAAADRGAAVSTMAEGAAVLAAGLVARGEVHGVLGMGGSGGTSIVSRAMREIPVGVPKLLVSTMGAGDTRPFVGISDIAMMFSVVDIAGINRVSERILSNAAAGLAGMAHSYRTRRHGSGGRPLVGATMYGATTPCVDAARRWLDEAGYEVLVFHATGTGGRSMESLMEAGYITAALEITPTEITDAVCGGTMSAGPDRMEVAGRLGLPQVVAPGAAEIIAFSPPETVPGEWADRSLYRHNAHVTLVRTTPEEAAEIGSVLATKLDGATGPVTVFVPLQGFSSYGVAGGVFHDPAADRALIEALRGGLDAGIEVVEMDTHINDPAFAEAMARRLDRSYREVFGE